MLILYGVFQILSWKVSGIFLSYNRSFPPVDVELIKCILISSSSRPDQWCWFYENFDRYSVKSGYKLARACIVQCGQTGVGVDFGW